MKNQKPSCRSFYPLDLSVSSRKRVKSIVSSALRQEASPTTTVAVAEETKRRQKGQLTSAPVRSARAEMTGHIWYLMVLMHRPIRASITVSFGYCRRKRQAQSRWMCSASDGRSLCCSKRLQTMEQTSTEAPKNSLKCSLAPLPLGLASRARMGAASCKKKSSFMLKEERKWENRRVGSCAVRSLQTFLSAASWKELTSACPITYVTVIDLMPWILFDPGIKRVLPDDIFGEANLFDLFILYT